MIGNRRYRNKIIGEQRYENNLLFIWLVDVTVFDWDPFKSKQTKIALLHQKGYRNSWVEGEKTGKKGKKIGEKIPFSECSFKRLTFILRKEYDLSVRQNNQYEENLRINHPLDYLTLLNTMEDVDERLLESAEERVAIVLSDLPGSELSELSQTHDRETLGAFYVEELFRTA